MGNYLLEDKITWDNLSPSLQAIISNKINITNIDPTLKSYIEAGDTKCKDLIISKKAELVNRINTELSKLSNKAADYDANSVSAIKNIADSVKAKLVAFINRSNDIENNPIQTSPKTSYILDKQMEPRNLDKNEFFGRAIRNGGQTFVYPFFHNRLFKNCLVCDTQEDIDKMKTIHDTMNINPDNYAITVRNNFIRFFQFSNDYAMRDLGYPPHYGSGMNEFEFDMPKLSDYGVSINNNMEIYKTENDFAIDKIKIYNNTGIDQTIHSKGVTLYPTHQSAYTVTATVTKDKGYLTFIVFSPRDETGTYISIILGIGHNNSTRLGVVFNAGAGNQIFFDKFDDLITTPANMTYPTEVKVYIHKIRDSVTFRLIDPEHKFSNGNVGFTWSIPTTIPRYFTEKIFTEIEKMRRNTPRFGFGSVGMDAEFRFNGDLTYSTNVLNMDKRIYDIANNIIHYRQNNVWKTKPMDELKYNYLFMYNEQTMKFFFRYNKDHYKRIMIDTNINFNDILKYSTT